MNAEERFLVIRIDPRELQLRVNQAVRRVLRDCAA